MNTSTPTDTSPATVRATRRRRVGLAAVLTCVSVVALPGAASASTGDDPGELHPRLERACLRIPNLQIRTENLLERLQADASTRGSLAWLQVQIDRADVQGREQLATVLENRLQVRTAAIDVLEQRADGLVQLAERCSALGVTP